MRNWRLIVGLLRIVHVGCFVYTLQEHVALPNSLKEVVPIGYYRRRGRVISLWKSCKRFVFEGSCNLVSCKEVERTLRQIRLWKICVTRIEVLLGLVVVRICVLFRGVLVWNDVQEVTRNERERHCHGHENSIY